MYTHAVGVIMPHFQIDNFIGERFEESITIKRPYLFMLK